ncbi:choice-of-anchor D domain-containing protein [Arthrobacter sp. ISL-72]|nr:choice-of-anchor D domain-containing protein [Arthrobacter sp. ISL-72]
MLLTNTRVGNRTSGGGRKTAALAAGLSMLATSLVGLPALAATVPPVPADAGHWTTSPYSPLPPAEVLAAGNAVKLGFDGKSGGLQTSVGAGTGFTMLQPSSADKSAPYFSPSNLKVSDGNLTILATPGASAGASNSQDNALGIGFTYPSQTLRLSTTIISPAVLDADARLGLWFGPNDQNFASLTVAGTGTAGERHVQLRREQNDVTEPAAVGTMASQDHVSVATTQTLLGDSPVRLTLDIDPSDKKLVATYQVGGGSPVAVGRLDLPTAFIDGSLLSKTAIKDVSAFGGVLASQGTLPGTMPLNAVFEEFSAEQVAAGSAPTAPAATSPTPTDQGSPSASTAAAKPSPTGSATAAEPPSAPGPRQGSTAPPAPGPGAKVAPGSPRDDQCLAGEWHAQYFKGTSLAGSPVVTGCTPTINQTYSSGNGPAGVGSEQYSAHWTRTMDAGAGTYKFTARADDGIRIQIDDQVVLDQWIEQSASSDIVKEVDLAEGPHSVTVEYFQAYADAAAVVTYSKQGPDTEAAIAPTQLLTEGRAGSVDLIWTASQSSDVAGYRVYRGTGDGVDLQSAPLTGKDDLVATSFSDETAQPDVAYYYSVTAVDTAGNESAPSNEAAAVTEAGDATAPDAPTSLAAVAGDTRVALSWARSASTDVSGYRVYRSLQPVVGETGALLSGPAPIAGTNYVDSTATNGTTYFYTVTAVDLSGNESVPSNEVHAVPVVPNTTNIKVDFTTTSGTPAPGYTSDWGEAYGLRSGANQGSGLTYGWKTIDGNPLSLVGNGRDRGRAGIDERLDSIIHMQYGDDGGTNGVRTEGIWEVAVPDGLYEVTVAVGDQAFAKGYDSLHAINLEAGIGIEAFQGSAAAEYRTATTTVGVWDGELTVTAAGGTNSKIAYIDVVGVERAPHVDTMRPLNRSVGHDPNDGVSATIRIPYAGVGVDPATLQGNVHLYEVASGAEVPSTTGTSGGNDVISTQQNAALKPGTAYRFVVTSNVKDNYGAPFKPFTSVFTTGSGVVAAPSGYTPLTGIAFEKAEQPVAAGKYWSSMAFGPDGKMYASTIGQGIFRFTVAADGTLSNMEDLGHAGRAIIGLVFDKASTATDPKVWITSTTANTFNETGKWVSGISLLSGARLQNEAQIFSHLPRSQADHLTNSMTYGPDGRLYFMQGSNQAAGDLDNSWGQRGETLLTAATLVFDPADPAVQQAVSTGVPIDVQTGDGGTYNPYSPSAPLKIFATGIRNAYDLVWHSNGHLYVPTNGTAGGANSPGVVRNADGTYTRVAADGIPGYSTVNGQDVTAQCQRRNYNGGSVPAIGNQPTQRDLLFDVVQGGYYGHPNPERCEWVLNEGNDPLNPPQSPGQGGSKYPSGTKADPNYRGIAYDFEFNKSPNGALEYKSNTFGGQLKGRVLVTRFSNNNDLIFLQPDRATGKILGAQTSVGITDVANSMIGGVDGFNDPLEVVEDPKTGNLYVNQYDRGGNDQKMFLLRVPGNQQAAPLTSSAPELVFSAVKNTTGATKTVTITNTGSGAVTLATALAGTSPAEFTTSGGNGVTLAAGASTTVQATFKPGSTVGQREAILRVSAGGTSLDIGLYGLSMNGIEGGNEPTFNDVTGTLGYHVNVGWTNLEGGTQATAKGDEVLEPLFVKSGTSPVSVTPLAQYAPREDLPFGWYTGDGAAAQQHRLGSIDVSGYQSLLPPSSPGTAQSFDPGTQSFGLYYYSNAFQRFGYTEDRLNTGIAHRARIYPAKNRLGVAIPQTYLMAFEDASNGDYQDYVFLVQGIKPASAVVSPGTDAIKVNFSNLAASLPAGYLRDFGEGFGPRTRADQGQGRSYGWKNQATETPLDMSTQGTAGPGNGRLRTTSQPDLRLNTLMHMQAADIPNFNGLSAYAYWEIALPAGEYDVKVAVGDPTVQTDTELHSINLEGRNLINRFAPSGAAGSNTRHTSASARVSVTDGYLTVDANSGVNTKIDYIEIVPASTDVPGDNPTEGAQVKVNFQTTTAPTPTGWTPDTGAAYSAQRKSGWLVGGVPTDRTAATRYRSAATAGISYPSDPLLQSFNTMGPANNVTTGVWEYEVPNGTYTVAASAGDSAYVDSVHGIAAEGQPLIANFIPTGTTPFQTGARQITVTDGKLTITSTGTNTKINWLSIKGSALDPAPDTTPSAKYNFTIPGAVTPTGWTADIGGKYDQDGYGWLVNGVPTERTTEGRNRPSAMPGISYPLDPLLQSLNQMQTASKGGTDGVWQRAVANGTYEVSLSVGDANYLDSTHAVEVEGKPVFAPFVPTGTVPFKTGTVTVDVTDGMLTLVPKGTNTKINWVTIKGANLAGPAISVDVNGQAVGTSYTGGQATVTLASQVAAGAQLTSLRYSVDGTPAVNYSAPFGISTGSHSLVVTSADSAGRSSSRTVTFAVQNIGGTLTLTNLQASRRSGQPAPGFYEDWLVMHRINTGVTNHKVTDTATAQLTNTGQQDLVITKLTISGTGSAGFTIVNPPTLPLTVAPGSSTPLTAKFVETAGSKGVRSAQVEITSSDSTTAVKNIQLRGVYMPAPEGSNEPTVAQLSQAFGITTNIGTPKVGDQLPTAPLNGEEVRSGLWKRNDPSRPVTVSQIASFHGCCTSGERIDIAGTTAESNALYGQTVLPLNNALTGLVELDANPAGTFSLKVGNQSTGNTSYLAIKTWPLRDRSGQLVTGTYVVGHDYMSSANECSSGPANCDYQDNVYIISNVIPAGAADTTAPAAPAGLTATVGTTAVDLAWTAGTESDLAGYHVERAIDPAGPWTRLTGSTPVVTAAYRDSAPPVTTTVLYRVLAVDTSANTSAPSATAQVNTTGMAAQPIRINAGGPAVSTGGLNWLADAYFTGGKTYTNPQVTQIAGTTDDALYLSERSGAGGFGYAIPVPSGNYTVKLHFAEIYHGATGGGPGGTGKRIFNVNLEAGTPEITNLDLNANVAPMTAYILTQQLNVTDGTLNIDFTATVDEPKISAIEIIPG